MKAEVRCTEDMTFIGKSETNHWVTMDANTAKGPGGASTPMELLLISLGGCTGIDMVSVLKKMKVPFSRFWIDIETERADDHPRVFTKFHMVFHFEGADLPLEKLQKAAKLSHDKYCSIGVMLEKSGPITYEVEIH